MQKTSGSHTFFNQEKYHVVLNTFLCACLVPSVNACNPTYFLVKKFSTFLSASFCKHIAHITIVTKELKKKIISWHINRFL